MKLSTDEEYRDLWFELLKSDDIQKGYKQVFDLFCASRSAGNDPQAILQVQVDACGHIFTLEQLKTALNKGGEELLATFFGHMRSVVKHIIDSLAWRASNYNRVLLQLLAEHPNTGHLDESILVDLGEAAKIVEEEQAIVLVNDLTHTLRYGDLTIFNGETFRIKENKGGKASKRNVRANYQEKNLNNLLRFLNLSFRELPDRRDYIIPIDTPIQTYHSSVVTLIENARKHGYAQTMLSDCLALEALWIRGPEAHIPEQRPFHNAKYAIPVNSLQISDLPVTLIAPYGIFPFDEKTCFELMTGELVLNAILNLEELQKKYYQFGLNLELPNPSKDEIKEYMESSFAERKKRQPELIIGDINSGIRTPLTYLWRSVYEFWHEETCIQVSRKIIELIKTIPFPEDKATRYYISYSNEKPIWR